VESLNLNPESLSARLLPDDSPQRISTPELVMLVVVGLTLAGNCLLVSAGEGVEAGHQAWRPGSVLRVVTELMTLNHQYPTARGVEIKWFIQGLGAAAALVVACAAWFLRSRREQEEVGPWPVAPSKKGAMAALSPTAGAQMAMTLFALWCVASAFWSPWPAGSFGEGLRELMTVVYAIAIGRTLSRAAAARAAQVLLGVLAVTAVIGIWYHYERNPVQRLKFPIGNPLFLAACLLPGVTLGLGAIAAAIVGAISRADEAQATREPSWRWGGIVWAAIAALSLGAFLWAMKLSDSRGPGLGLGIGLLAVLFLVLPRFWRWLPPLGVAGFLALAWTLKLWPVSWLMSRPDTVRFRLDAWKYALAMFLGRPDIGRGQGSYLLLAQGMSRPDAEQDPAAFLGEVVGHAHNEWLQVLAETGAIGFALLATALGVTIWAAVVVLRRRRSTVADVLSTTERWCLLGLLAAFVAIIVEDATDVGLRLPGLPVIFYTVLGLVWALSSRRDSASAAAIQSGEVGAGERESGGAGGQVDGQGDGSAAGAVGRADHAARELDSHLSAHDSLPGVIQGNATSATGVPQSGAFSEFEPASDGPGRHHAVLRVGGLLLGIAAAYGMFAVNLRDWTGALADPLISEASRKHQWVDALNAAEVAGSRRLSMDAGIAAQYQGTRVAHDAALDRVRQMRGMYEHLRSGGGDRATISRMTAEDAEAFKVFFTYGVQTGVGLIERMPGYPYVSVYLADLWLARQDFDTLGAALTGRAQTQPGVSSVDEARHWLTTEYQRDRLNADVALRLLQMTGEMTPAGTAARINLLRLPMRRGALPPSWEPALAAVMRDPYFGPVMDELVKRAQAAVANPDAPWSDAYLPETLRLAALAKKLQGRLEDAPGLCGQAAVLSERIRDRWPAAVSEARREQAYFLLIARPNEPKLALAAMEQGLQAWPANGDHDRLMAMYRGLSLYQLASGDVPGARETLRELARVAGAPDFDKPEALNRSVGYGYAELAGTLSILPPESRPATFDMWVNKALELAPQNPTAYAIAARVEFERGQDGPAVEQLAAMEKIVADPAQFGPVLQRFLEEFPNSWTLQDFAVKRFGPAVTQPASEPE
jgi:O-antigen ligase